MTNTVRIGQLPGRINEFAFEQGSTLGHALEVAGLDATGYEVKVDGVKVSDFETSIDGASVIMLTKMVKGNSEFRTVRVGQLPGRINEYSFTPPTTFNEVLEVAELDATGYEVKADGVKVTNFDQEIGNTSVIMLTKMVKGNK